MFSATIRHDGRISGARIEGELTVVLDAPDAVAAWATGGRDPERSEVDTATAHFARTSPSAQHILCIGLNYRSRIEQLGRPLPEYLTFFAKFHSTLTGPRDTITPMSLHAPPSAKPMGFAASHESLETGGSTRLRRRVRTRPSAHEAAWC